MSPTLRDHLFEKLVLGLVSCILVQSQMDEYLKQMEYPPERGYDRNSGSILDISCEQNGLGALICPDDGQMMRPPRPGAPAPGAPGPRRLGPQASALVRPSIRHVLGGLLPPG